MTCGNQHGNRLVQHGRFGFNAAHAPAEHAKSIDHRRMRVRSDERVGIGQRITRRAFRADEDYARQVLEVHLMNDAGIRRNDREILEPSLSPSQEGIAFLIALKFQFGVEQERLWRAKFIHLYRVINHQFRG